MSYKLLLTACVAVAAVLQTVPTSAEVKDKVNAKTVEVKVRVDNEAPGFEGTKAMDGNPHSMWHTRWNSGETPLPHQIVVDLGAAYNLSGLVYLPRPGGGNGTIKDYEVYVSNNDKDFGKPVLKGAFAQPSAENTVTFPAKVKGRYLKLVALSEVNGRPWTSIAALQPLAEGVEFRATGSTETGQPVRSQNEAQKAATEFERQFATLKQDVANAAKLAQVAHQVQHPAALIDASDRDPVDVVLRRTRVLLDDIKVMPGATDLAALEKQLVELQAAAAQVDVADGDARFALFQQACHVRRQIAFANPLLDFDQILFIKRHRSGYNHMCDQYYGVHAKPGGGLYVLSDPFGQQPQVRDVLAGSVVEQGRLQGRELTTGSFLSPDLSYDANTIAFAYVECQGDRAHRFHTDPTQGHWSEGQSYHLFKVNVDGTGLLQLTDGTWNDFDPCWLPNGRLAFITERRGGYLRCGRVCPTYTLFDMNDDGSGIRCLSFHETNEWHPSVTHDGRIIYTRWDYVDRHGCTAHLPWITTPDGRDSRAVHGNFAPRQSRPDMELDVRAIPGSHKFVATAAPHHGQAFGSLVVIDPRIVDDDAMAPVRRTTPEVGFPESQGGAQVYGTPWPLGENYFLCVYDDGMKPGAGRQGRAHVAGNYGIYLVDCFGNKELIYRDRTIACQSPIPLRPRTTPPVMPQVAKNQHRTEQTYAPTETAAEATLAVIDVYDSLKAWPEDAQVTELRVLQILPMTVPSGRPPHEIGLRLPSGRDSVILARHVLGTVPVEKDGSADFSVPAEREIFFQALDQDGLAVQSMRSATYLQAGERLLCVGCHERKHEAPRMPADLPLALRRPPSRLVPDVEGSNPFSYAQLIQPVLDRKCVDCHQKNADKKAPNLAREPIQKHWFASYHSLAPKYGFWNYQHSHRTTPGQFGARASKLYEILTKGHHDLELTAEEMHRITLWLDCCSVFYGVYEKEGGEAQLRGEVVHPTLE